MKGVILPDATINRQKNHFHSIFYSYLLLPLKSGFFGFAIFFTSLLLVKTCILFIDKQGLFIVNVGDVALSLIGFASFYLVRVFQSLKKAGDKAT
jgi:hypothetical protein